MSLNSFQVITAPPDKMMDLASLWLLNQFSTFMGKWFYMDTWKHDKDTAKNSDAHLIASSFCLPGRGAAGGGGGEEQLAQINSNLNPISGRPISIGGIITGREASYSTTRVQVYRYNQLDPGTSFAHNGT